MRYPRLEPGVLANSWVSRGNGLSIPVDFCTWRSNKFLLRPGCCRDKVCGYCSDLHLFAWSNATRPLAI
jgi:hypothetical protein